MSTKMTWEDACLILGVPLTATAAEIKKQYIYKVNIFATDRLAAMPERIRLLAEDDFKKINIANDFLKDPRNRPNNNPPKLHVSLKHVRFNIENGQTKRTTFKIDNTGGPYTSFWMDDSPAEWLKVTEAKSLSDTPLPIEVTLEATGMSVPKRHAECFLPIRIENEPTKAMDELKLKIELNLNTASTGTLTPGASPGSNSFSLLKMQKWVMVLILIGGLSVIGFGISLYTGNFIPLWVLSGFSCIFALEKWFTDSITRFKAIHGIYKLILNLSLLSLLGLLIWSGIQLFSHHFFKSALTGSLIFIGEFVLLVWIWRIYARHSAQWPSMKLTIFSLIGLFFVFTFAGVSPFVDMKDRFFALF
jgi:hypothetical protein